MTKLFYWLPLVIMGFISLKAQSPDEHGRLKASADGHFLQLRDGTPFFWLGDTGWELFHRLTIPEITTYLDNRSAKGFNVIQAVVLAEFDGLKRPNRYGQLPFENLDPLRPNEKYFEIIDTTIKLAQKRNLFIGLLPTWGDKVTKLWGTGPVIFDSINAYAYGKWIGSRYKDCRNIIWILGGDRPAVNEKDDWRPVWRAMAKGIIEGTDNQCMITYHPSGGSNSTSQWIQQESWLGINMFQSGHGSGHDVACWELVQRDRGLTPVKPVLDAEPNYEDHPVNPWPKWNPDNGYFRDYDVRKQLYRSVFAGACGVTYGHHAVWQFMGDLQEAVNYPDRGWLNAMDRPGAFQAGLLKKLISSRSILDRVPDSTIIVKGQSIKGEHAEAFHAANGSYLMVYLPVGKTISISTRSIKGQAIKIFWFNPKNGAVESKGNFVRKELMELTPPTLGVGNDWVLVIDDADLTFPLPGSAK